MTMNTKLSIFDMEFYQATVAKWPINVPVMVTDHKLCSLM